MPRRSARPRPDRILELTTHTRDCPACGRRLWAANEPQRTVVTLEGLVRLRLQVRACRNPACPRHRACLRPAHRGAKSSPLSGGPMYPLTIGLAIENRELLEQAQSSLADLPFRVIVEHHEPSAALRRRLCHGGGADASRGSGPVFDDHGRTESLLQAVLREASDDVG